jgi:F0F1-type ATP synthase assembly protein I
MVASVAVGFAIGYWLLDMYVFPELLNLNTFPLFTMIFLLLGIVAGFLHLFKVTLRQKDNGDSDEGS